MKNKDEKKNSFQSLAQRYNDNAEMVINNNNQIKHHTEELEKIVTLKTEVPAWVVAKVNRSASDLSDATHYLEGRGKYAQGGGISMEKELLSTVIQVQAQIKILHWQTESYAQHKAFNEAYKKLGDLFDNLIEVYSGKYNRPNFGGIKNITFSDYYNVRIETFLDTTIDFFTNLFIAEQDSELANIRDEIKAELEQLKYLLTLK